MRFAPLAARLSYLTSADVAWIRAAYEFADQAHGDEQQRASGEPYIVHPLEVAATVAEWRLDAEALMAALLHDVVEDTAVTTEDLAARFGEPVAKLVEALTKYKQVQCNNSRADTQAASFRKMLCAMDDPRVILIKLADRLHNMRTLGALAGGKQRRIGRETMRIYVPIASVLGLSALCRELADRAFEHGYPSCCRQLQALMAGARNESRRNLLDAFRADITAQLGLPEWGGAKNDCVVEGCDEPLHSLYSKIVEKIKKGKAAAVAEPHSLRERIRARVHEHDIYCFRVIVADEPSCYLALGALHARYRQLGGIEDYISNPHSNGYQSLHTTLIGPGGVQVEVQIRTRKMDYVAELGLAACWRWRELIDDKTISALRKNFDFWRENVLEFQEQPGRANEYFTLIQAHTQHGEICVISPKGEPFNLPRGSTPVDFAYAVHTEVGHYCCHCRINAVRQPLNTELQNGDRIEIITLSGSAQVKPEWLKFVHTGRAKEKIRHFLKNRQPDVAIDVGERWLDEVLRRSGYSAATISPPAWQRFLRDWGGGGDKTRRNIFAEIGWGERQAEMVARRLLLAETNGEADGGDMPRVRIQGNEGVGVQLAHCCRPIPYEPVIGIFRDGRLEIHVQDCPQERRALDDPARWIDVEWEQDEALLFSHLFDVTLLIGCQGGHGMLERIEDAIGDAGSNIQRVVMEPAHTDTPGPGRDVTLTVQVKNQAHLEQIMSRMSREPGVVSVTRARSQGAGKPSPARISPSSPQ
ncbi:guanosine-3',5'-bis(diphosphate) 3'-pyrophosphohydrolase [Betaproteobacteria bacterium]|nr:guanosine-3',5'-bis(diphosphate) 3'-pyrophosphohydrolase [Betaproteobacteria bacterium]